MKYNQEKFNLRCADGEKQAETTRQNKIKGALKMFMPPGIIFWKCEE
jgi:hypothetical protein